MIDIDKTKEALVKVGQRMFITKEEHKQWCETISKEPYEKIKEYQDVKKAINELERLQQKETPASPILLPLGNFECSECHNLGTYWTEKKGIEKPNCCSHCGQRLEWGKHETNI